MSGMLGYRLNHGKCSAYAVCLSTRNMTYTTGTMSGVTSFDDFVLPRGNLRLLVLGANLIRFGILAAALVVASMRVTWMMLDYIDARPHTLAQRPAGRTPEVL